MGSEAPISCVAFLNNLVVGAMFASDVSIQLKRAAGIQSCSVNESLGERADS